jgi:mannose-1-phosphate guanylyltransferase
MYIVILAGGSGTRFWPLSRAARPKQLISLTGDRSMLQRTVERVLPLKPKRILIP